MFGFVKEDTYLELLEEKTDLEQENDMLRDVIRQKDKAIMDLRYKRGGDGNAVIAGNVTSNASNIGIANIISVFLCVLFNGYYQSFKH